MAQRRMLSLKVIDTDEFLDMPMSSQFLYYNLAMRADDDGFLGNPKKIMKMVNCNQDDLKVLITKSFVIPFESGVCVIRHWRVHNLIRNDRYTETQYQSEKSKLTEHKGKYDVIPNDTQMEPQVRLGKVRLGKVTTSKDVEPAKVVYGNKEVNWLVEEFKNVMGFSSAGGSKDRVMATHLLRNFTKEQLTSMLRYCADYQYAPRIGSVEKMWFKRGDIIAGIKSESNKAPKMTILE